MNNETPKAEWDKRMVPVTEKTPLQDVANWWLDMWEWRTEELAAGRGNVYDFHPSYRTPWSMVRSKFPWLNEVDDRCDLSLLVTGEMKRRSKRHPQMREWYKELMKERRDFNRSR